jgi:LPXTG-site transpeptidase (sortase) family protein
MGSSVRRHLARKGIALGLCAGVLAVVGGCGSPADHANSADPPGSVSAAATTPTSDPTSAPSKPKDKQDEQDARAVPRLAPAPPEVVQIPGLRVRAEVLAVAMGRDRTLLPPRNPHRVGWWSGSAAPGFARGGTVIAGHTVHTGGGAFDHLGRLKRGSAVDVRTATGTMRYRVDSVATYDKTKLAKAAPRLFGQDVGARLVLVTCDDWDGEAYLSNVVVIATPVRATPF